jgi:AcrR family transcriptional regulator
LEQDQPVSPRPYRLGRRQADADATQARILAAARAVLSGDDAPGGFTIDAVARQADVARQTVYNRFGSKTALLEALFDDLAARGGLERLPGAFQEPEPLTAVRHFIGVFTQLWATQPLVHRRLAGLAALDPELARLRSARAEWRREGLRVLLAPLPAAQEEAVDVLHTLTGFATYEALARGGRSTEQVADLIDRMGRAFLLAPPGSGAAP